MKKKTAKPGRPKKPGAKSRRQRVEKFRARERDITYKAPEDIRRRRKLETDLSAWLKYYLHDLFPLPWAEFHRSALADLQHAIKHGGNVARALPRGSGKTCLCKGTLLWAILTGQKHYGLLIGATARKGKLSLRDIKTILRYNDRLNADYPEVCGPIRDLRGIALRTRAQTAYGKPTSMQWTGSSIVFPNTPRLTKRKTKTTNPSAGAILEVDGITGDIRGHVFVLPDGRSIRPDVAIVDDPQTKQSAKSVEQCKSRLEIITQDIAGSAGPGEYLSVLVPLTVIVKGDLGDQLLDAEKHPEFQSERRGMFLLWPDNMALWEGEYRAAWARGLKLKDAGKRANAFYRKHRKKLDAGAQVSWAERKGDLDLSAIQHAMNFYFKFGKKGFACEFQNEPIDDLESVYAIAVDQVAAQVNGLKRREVPENASILTGFVDINHNGLSWVMMASSNSLARYVIDYGVFPGRGKMIWEEGSPITESLAIAQALTAFDKFLLTIPIFKGTERMPFDLFSIDVGGRWMQAVFDWLGSVGKASQLEYHGSRGWSYKSYAPSRARVGKPGEQWHKARWPGKGKVYVHSADYWRADTQKGFLLPPGTAGSVSLFGSDLDRHLEYARQVCSEKLIRYIEGDIRDTYEWSKPNHLNDLLDATVGASVGASTQGASTSDESQTKTRKKNRRPAQATDPSKTTKTAGAKRAGRSNRRGKRRGGFATNW